MIDPEDMDWEEQTPQRHDKNVGTDYGHGNAEDDKIKKDTFANLIDKEWRMKKIGRCLWFEHNPMPN